MVLSDLLSNSLTIGNVRLSIEKEERDTVIFFFLVLSVLRFITVGVNNAATRGIPSFVPCVLEQIRICHPKKRHKLAESLWYLVWHVTSMTFTITVLRKEYGTDGNSWLYHLSNDLKGVWFFTDPPINMKRVIVKWPLLVMSPEARLLVLISLGFWISCLVYINWETRRSDMNILCFHHVTTILLMAVAHIYNFYRISLLVILFHDIPDVLLYATKSLSYITFMPKGIITTFFVFYGLSHFLCRFIFFARYIVYPIMLNLGTFEYIGGKIEKPWQLPGGLFCPISLICLTVMNIYWLNLILRIFKMAVVENKDVEDVREYDD